MGQFVDRLMFLRKDVEKFSDGWGVVTRESRRRRKPARMRHSPSRRTVSS
ncbi:MAG: hypothetical protein ACRETZ_07255 [Steroidobacteraceae bacterium]